MDGTKIEKVKCRGKGHKVEAKSLYQFCFRIEFCVVVCYQIIASEQKVRFLLS